MTVNSSNRIRIYFWTRQRRFFSFPFTDITEIDVSFDLINWLHGSGFQVWLDLHIYTGQRIWTNRCGGSDLCPKARQLKSRRKNKYLRRKVSQELPEAMVIRNCFKKVLKFKLNILTHEVSWLEAVTLPQSGHIVCERWKFQCYFKSCNRPHFSQ